ncbi:MULTISPECIES: enoyl-CoA hydratase/isomerase family protein [unclassified Ruegeria]|uniref:enoyl-CoA hydratase/isomerase family protein n=1 Tax=unclassified Ruegeria TaxID=2625375 RepID=UPI001487C451|nr:MULTISPECIES: enoyl-CoA hydratase/isomerase family protein [unclassified Ruegeria]NOD75282.1 enoyl-CoA hydratase/isomerase family protein [Ruegeria sp. HKCCD4332]NOD87243.1 enoyl-CoA hydratase/isomerase family protein [Ruegeria sp. HKCCD4318]NOE12798.1 enoyl-CoA hydratase/isomerase family protein [Ruegeria sp. HKCCD4318-2]NOG09036.1 enoyl-CoA hydratase/isomerase family protein [Ruegeria sp. HKCCD4315]
MSDIEIRTTGRAGRITLTRPHALNALSYEMCMAIDTAMRNWREDDAVDLIILDAEGEKAFCAGGDIAELYDTGTKGDYAYGQTFWRDEYRLNAMIFEYPKPVVSFLQGFTMGGGVGIGCHGSHRVVGESSKISMPECSIGLVPDVGGSLMLALAPGRLGEFLGTTGFRMGPADAILAGFADHYIPQSHWSDLIEMLEASGDAGLISQHAETPPAGELAGLQADIDQYFSGETLGDIVTSLRNSEQAFSQKTLSTLGKNAPLSTACTVEMLHRLRGPALSIRRALELEYRFTHRSMEHGDFLEGIRAQIIDKDRSPNWQFPDMNVPLTAVSKMLQPLGADTLTFEED